MQQRHLRILFVSAEVTPFARTGGLGDVVGALPKTLTALGCDVRVVMPLYQTVRDHAFPLRLVLDDLRVPLVFGVRTARVWQGSLSNQVGQGGEGDDVPVYFIEQDAYFARPGLYGAAVGDYPDNALRFIFFCRAALALAERLEWFPHVFHCHDWHTGLVPAWVRFLPGLDVRLSSAATLFTIHNLAYQGRFPGWTFGVTGLPSLLFQPAGVEFFGGINSLKAGLLYADQLTTVSPSYAEEICTAELGYGLDGVLRERRRERRDALVGILNGVDYAVWNPETDPALAAGYSAADLGGKAVCKTALLRAYGMPEDLGTPLIGVVSRLVDQKGVDLLVGALDSLLGLDMRLVILGSGESRYEGSLTALARAYPDRIGVQLGFNDALAHQIEAGCDLFLMPSRYEPCGLNQIYSLRYGTIPVVRATGGLRDTVIPFELATSQGTGFLFQEPTTEALIAAVRTALSVFNNRQAWQQMMRNAMAQDFSWTRSAERYLTLYHRAVEAKSGAHRS